jgi:hypothetical protein
VQTTPSCKILVPMVGNSRCWLKVLLIDVYRFASCLLSLFIGAVDDTSKEFAGSGFG